jgi:hypothetical protein
MRGGVRLYTLEVLLVSGPVPESFTRDNPVVARTVQLRGDQTLAELHQAIFTAFGRTQEQMYEFQLGKGPLGQSGQRYVLPGAAGMTAEGIGPPAGLVTETTLDALRLEVGSSVIYWFDFAADWWHRITIKRIEEKEPRGKYPKVKGRVGADPPQPAADDPGGTGGPQTISEEAAADMSCLIGELHLSRGNFARAVEAFTRAIESSPNSDAYLGRARAYRGLAADDERKARELG